MAISTNDLSTRQVRDVELTLIHPEYEHGRNLNDIAVLKVSNLWNLIKLRLLFYGQVDEPFEPTKAIYAARIAKSSPYGGQICSLTGWELTGADQSEQQLNAVKQQSNQLNRVDVQVIGYQKCKHKIRSLVQGAMICGTGWSPNGNEFVPCIVSIWINQTEKLRIFLYRENRVAL